MSAKEFEEIERKFYIMVEDGQLLAHGSDGTVSATQGKRFEFLAESEKQRDTWIRAINLLVGAGGDSSSGLVSGPAIKDGSVTVRRVPLPQLRRKQPVHSSRGTTIETLPRVAAQARRAATVALDLNGGDVPVAKLVKQTPDAVEAVETARSENQDVPIPATRPKDGNVAEDGAAENTLAVEMDDAATTDDCVEGEEEDEETERLAGIAMSRIASFEAAAQPRVEAEAAQQYLEAQWQKTAKKFSSSSSSHLLDSSAEDASPPKVQKMTGGNDLGGILAARRKAQEQSADDGYYF